MFLINNENILNGENKYNNIINSLIKTNIKNNKKDNMFFINNENILNGKNKYNNIINSLIKTNIKNNKKDNMFFINNEETCNIEIENKSNDKTEDQKESFIKTEKEYLQLFLDDYPCCNESDFKFFKYSPVGVKSYHRVDLFFVLLHFIKITTLFIKTILELLLIDIGKKCIKTFKILSILLLIIIIGFILFFYINFNKYNFFKKNRLLINILILVFYVVYFLKINIKDILKKEENGDVHLKKIKKYYIYLILY
jgi:hypothetical protein